MVDTSEGSTVVVLSSANVAARKVLATFVLDVDQLTYAIQVLVVYLCTFVHTFA